MNEGIRVYYVYLPGSGYYKRNKHKALDCGNAEFVSDYRTVEPYKLLSRARRTARKISPRAAVEAREWR